ncbi:MAG: hypothetical protein ACKVUT_02920 [Gaiella sp.]
MTSSRFRFRSPAGVVLGLGLLAAAWWFLAPPEIGGHTGYRILRDGSMEPGLRSGDLVIVRDRGAYDAGDAILFQDGSGGVVYHRIVALADGGYVTRGDNAVADDPEVVPAGSVLGSEWLTLPRVGDATDWLTAPAHYGPLALTIVLVLLVLIRRSLRRRDVVRSLAAGDPLPREWLPPQTLRSLCIGSGVAGLIFGGLAVYAWASPEHRAMTVPDALVQQGAFSYDADVRPSAVYPDGRVTTGQVVFTRLVSRMRVAFEYSVTARGRTAVRGGVQLEAVLSDTRGWTRTFVIVPEQPFSDRMARVEGVLSVRALTRAARQMPVLTGSRSTAFELTLRPRVTLAGYAAGSVVDSTFAPGLRFAFDGVSLAPVAGAAGLQSALRPRQATAATALEQASLGVGDRRATVTFVRRVGALGVLTSLLLFAAGAVLLAARVVGGEPARIAARYGSRILDARIVVPESRWVTEVEDIETLVRLAEHYDRPVLHGVEGLSDIYIVDDGVAVYRFHLPEVSLSGRALRAS